MKSKALLIILIPVCIAAVVMCAILASDIGEKNDRIDELEKTAAIERAIIDSALYPNPFADWDRDKTPDDVIILSRKDSNRTAVVTREYDVRVAVKDIENDLGRADKDTSLLRRLVGLSNVFDLNVLAMYAPNTFDLIPEFPDVDDFRDNRVDFSALKPGESMKKYGGDCESELLFFHNLSLDRESTYWNFINSPGHRNYLPVYPVSNLVHVGPDYPFPNPDSIISYSRRDLNFLYNDHNRLMIFRFALTLPFKDGWYRIILDSRTNKVVSILPRNPAYTDDVDFKYYSINRSLVYWYLDRLYEELKPYGVTYYKINLVPDNYFPEVERFNIKNNNAQKYAHSIITDKIQLYDLQKKLNTYSYLSNLSFPRSMKEVGGGCEGHLEYTIRVIVR